VVYDMPQLGEKEGEFYINNNLDVVTQKWNNKFSMKPHHNCKTNDSRKCEGGKGTNNQERRIISYHVYFIFLE
jgi:hypothetical protein